MSFSSRIDSHARYRRTASSRSCSRSLVDSEEDQRVLVQARRVAARFENRFLANDLGGDCLLLAVGIIVPSTTSRASRSSGTSWPDAGSGWMRLKSPGLAQIGAQPLVEFLHHLVGIALELLGAISASLVTVGWVEYQ